MSKQETFEFTVSETNRLDSFLACKMGLTRNKVQSSIKAGDVKVDGKMVAKPSYQLKYGEIINFIAPKPVEKVDLIKQHLKNLEIVYEDKYLLIVNKQPGIVCHPALGHHEGTMSNFAYGYLDAFPYLIHRLDKDTSGLLAFAKDENTHQLMQKLWKDRQVIKKYQALCCGQLDSDQGLIDSPIRRSKQFRQKMAISPESNSKEAKTQFKVIARYDQYSFLDINLKTGRTHQIRVHLNAINHPVCGDEVYGRNQDNQNLKELGLNRQFLHAYYLEFMHPVLKKDIKCKIDLACDLKSVLEKLTG